MSSLSLGEYGFVFGGKYTVQGFVIRVGDITSIFKNASKLFSREIDFKEFTPIYIISEMCRFKGKTTMVLLCH